MAVPSFRINYHRLWRQLVSLITDGRYSGTNFGVSVGHVTPEAIRGGGILYLQTGDLLHLKFRAGRIDLLDAGAFAARGELEPFGGELSRERAAMGAARQGRLEKRGQRIAPSNRMLYHTDAAEGVVPAAVAEWAHLRGGHREGRFVQRCGRFGDHCGMTRGARCGTCGGWDWAR
jgi:hypothetical protein